MKTLTSFMEFTDDWWTYPQIKFDPYYDNIYEGNMQKAFKIYRTSIYHP